MVSLAEENYLKALWSLELENGEVSVKELSDYLHIKMPTVNSMMKKLAEKKFVLYTSYKPLNLTELGKTTAALIVRKHRLTEMFLVEKMGFGWEEVHEIAEQIEHIHSPAFFEKMDALLGYPKIDPHGSPIPDSNGKMEWISYKSLSDCEAGTTVTIAAVMHSSDEFLKFLNSRNLQLGVEIKIKSKEPFDQSMTVSYEGKRHETFSKIVCDKLLVK
jgi:DtxR family Mn-dependent transcriptional regulator